MGPDITQAEANKRVRAALKSSTAAPPTALRPDRCGNCFYMDSNDSGQTFCRRFPAQLVPVPGSMQALFPIVNPLTDWCGEFDLKSEVEKRRKSRIVTEKAEQDQSS